MYGIENYCYTLKFCNIINQNTMKKLKLICFVLIFSTLISTYTNLEVEKGMQQTTVENTQVTGNEKEYNDGCKD